MNDERTNARESCEAIEPLLSAYLLEELPGAERPRVTAHLDDCPRCRKELAGIEKTVKLLAAAPGTEATLAEAQKARIIERAAGPRAKSIEGAAGPRAKSIEGAVVRPAALAGAGSGRAAARPGRRGRNLAWLGTLAAAILVAGVVGRFVRVEKHGGIESPAAGGGPEVELARAGEMAPPMAKESSPADLLKLQDGPRAPAPTTASSLEPGNGEVIAEREKLPLLALNKDFSGRAAGPAELDEVRKHIEEQVRLVEEAGRGARERQDAKKASEGLLRAQDAWAVQAAEPRGLSESKSVGEPYREYRQAVENGAKVEATRRGSELYDLEAGKAADLSTRLTAATPSPEPGQQVAQEKAGGMRLQRGEAALPAPGQQVARNEVEARRSLDRLADRSRGGAPGGAGGLVAQAPEAGAAAKPLSAEEKSKAPAAAAAPRAEAPVAAGAAAAESAPAAPAGAIEAKLAAAAPPAVAGTAPARDAAAATSVAPDWKARVEDYLTRLDRLPGETPRDMFFRYWGTNPFVEAQSDPLSTFAADVDTASYTLFRSYITERGLLPPREAIRTEEFVNYFKGAYPPPTAEGEAFAIHTEIAPNVFAHEPDYKLLRVGIKAREVTREKRKACSLVFVVDTSGSMRQGNRLELVKEALQLLVPELDEGDTIGMVAFDREARTILDPVPASEKERILSAIATLQPRQNTNVNAGLELGYAMAAGRQLRDGSNRIILLSDGVANTGVVEPQAMLERVRSQRQGGIYLTCVGVGMGNHNDALLEALADGGDGQCVYVDRMEEARKAFVENLTGTLETIARDVKIQVEFDPARVIRYRLLGYENRAVADADFRNNAVDAGEVGAGHEVTALYELKLKPEVQGKLATVRLRYLTVEHREAVEMERAVETAAVKGAFVDASPRFQLSACVGEAAEILRESYWARGSNLSDVAARLEPLGPQLGTDKDFPELVALVKRADVLVRDRQGRTLDDVARAVEAVKEQNLLQAQVETSTTAASERDRAHLEEIRRQTQELRRRLEEVLQRQ